MTVKGLIGSAAPANAFGSGEVVHLAEGECLDPKCVYVDLMLSSLVLGMRCTKNHWHMPLAQVHANCQVVKYLDSIWFSFILHDFI